MKNKDKLMYSKLVEFWGAMETNERGGNVLIDYWLDYLEAYSEGLDDMEDVAND